MDIGRIADKAKQAIEDRGGMDSLKEDAAELKDIATGEGSLKDKAKAAVEAIKDPGAKDEPAAAAAPEAESGPTPETPKP